MLNMHKIHHKIILGIAAVAVIGGIVYVANQSKAVTGSLCPAKAFTLNETNRTFETYVPISGDTRMAQLSYDATKMALTSSDYTGGTFTLTTASGTKMDYIGALDLNVFTSASRVAVLPQFDYRNKDAVTQIFTNVKYDPTLSKDLTFSTETLSLKSITLTELSPTYAYKNMNFTWDTKSESLLSDAKGFSIDGGVTYYGFPVTLQYLQELTKSGAKLYVDDGRGTITQLGVNYDQLNRALTLSVEADCDVPPDPCNTKNVLSKANPDFKSPIGTVSFDGLSLFSRDNLNMVFSSNNIDYFQKYDANMAQKIPLVYVRDEKTLVTIKLTNASYDPTGLTFGFDYLAPATEDVVFSKAVPMATLAGMKFSFDGAFLSYDAKLTSMSIGGKILTSPVDMKMLLEAQKAGVAIEITNLLTTEVTTVSKVAFDSLTGNLTISVPAKVVCGPKDTDRDGVADDVDKCPDTKADTVTNLKPRNLAVFDVNGVLTWMTNVKTAKNPVIEPVQALSLTKTLGCTCYQILALKETKEKIDDDKNEREGLYGDEDRDQNRERDEDNNNSRLKYGCTALGGKDNTPTTKVTGIVGDFIKKAAKWSDDRSQEERDRDESRDNEDDRS